ncbi:uncharacterized protein CBL_01921 [Carabus blaptoides fortunei]
MESEPAGVLRIFEACQIEFICTQARIHMKAMLKSPFTRCTLTFLVATCVIVLLHNTAADTRHYEKMFNARSGVVQDTVREKRATRKPGFFWVLGSNIFHQFNDTRSAIRQIRKLINNQFIDERKPAPAKVPVLEPNATTTEAPYRISRKEFNNIIMRNLRGIARLYNLEWNAAVKQSEQNRADFNKQLRYSIKKELS